MNTVYVFDDSLSPRLAMCLNVLLPEPGQQPFVVEHTIGHLTEDSDFHYGEGNDVWIPRLAEQGAILVTCLSSSKRRLVADTLSKAGVRAVHLADGFAHLTTFQQASRLAEWWESIVKKSYRLKSGECIVVNQRGGISDK